MVFPVLFLSLFPFSLFHTSLIPFIPLVDAVRPNILGVVVTWFFFFVSCIYWAHALLWHCKHVDGDRSVPTNMVELLRSSSQVKQPTVLGLACTAYSLEDTSYMNITILYI